MADNLSIEIDTDRALASLNEVGNAFERLVGRIEQLKGAKSTLDGVAASTDKIKLPPDLAAQFNNLNDKIKTLATDKITELQNQIRQLKPEQLDEMARAFAKIKELQSGLASGNVTQLSRSLGTLGQEAGGIAGMMDKLVIGLKGVLGGMLGVNTSTLNVGRSFVDIANAARATEGDLGSVTSAFDAMTTGGKALVAAGLVAFFVSLGMGIASIASPAIHAAEEVQKFTSSLNSVTKGDLGTQLFANLNANALKTGVAFADVANAAQKYAVAAHAAGLSNKEIETSFNQLTIGFRGLGLSAGDTTSAFRALEQMMSKGKIQAQELVLQLGNAVPGSLAIAAKALGTTEAGLRAMAEAGTLLPTDFVRKFAEEMGKAFGDAFNANMRTVTAQMSIFGIVFNQVMQSVGGGGFVGLMHGIADALAGVNSILIGVLPYMQALGALFGDLVGGPLSAFGRLLGVIGTGLQMFNGWVEKAYGAIKTFFSELATDYPIIGAVASAVRDVGIALSNMFTVLGTGGSYIVAAGVALGGLAGAARIAIGVFGLLAGAASTVFGFLGTAGTTALGAVSGVSALSNAVGALRSAFALLTASPIGLMLGTFAVTLAGLTAGWMYYQNAVAKAAADSASAADATSRLNNAVKDGYEGVTRLANGYGTLEGELRRHGEAAKEVDNQLKMLKQAQKDQADGMRQLNLESKESSLSYQREKEAMKASIDVMKTRAERAKELDKAIGGGISTASTYTERVTKMNQAMRGIDESARSAASGFEAQKLAASQSAESLKEQIEKLERAKESFSRYGVIVGENNGNFVRLAEAMGLQDKAAGNLAAKYELLTRSADGWRKLGDDEIAKINQRKQASQELLGIMQRELEFELAKPKNTQDNLKIAKIKEEIEARERSIKDYEAERLAIETISIAKSKNISLQEAAVQAIQKYGEGVGGTATASAVAAAALDKMNNATKDVASRADQAANSQAKQAEQTRTAGEETQKVAEKTAQLSDSISKAVTAIDSGSEAISIYSSRMTNIGASTSQAADALGTIRDALSPLAQQLPAVTTQFAALNGPATDLAGTLPEISAAFSRISDAAVPISTNLPAIASGMTALAAAATTLQEPVTVVADSFDSLGTSLPTVAPQLSTMVGSLTALVEPTTNFANALTKMADASDRLPALATTVDTIIESMTRLGEAGGAATAALDAMAHSTEAVGVAFTHARDNAVNFGSAVTSLESPIDSLVNKMVALKNAAEAALRASREAAQSSSSTVDQKREGGTATSRIDPMRVPDSAFHGAPHFAEGTANTSNYLNSVKGGGIPSILHPNEAVIPLSKGRSVPVEISMSTNESAVASLTEHLTRSMTDVVRDHTARNSSKESVESSQPQRVLRNNAVVAYATQNSYSRPAPNRDSTDTSEPVGGSGNTIIHMNIQTPDADSFRKSADQIKTETYKKMRTAFARNA